MKKVFLNREEVEGNEKLKEGYCIVCIDDPVGTVYRFFNQEKAGVMYRVYLKIKLLKPCVNYIAIIRKKIKLGKYWKYQVLIEMQKIKLG